MKTTNEYLGYRSAMSPMTGNFSPSPRTILLTDAIYRELAELARIECENASDDYVRIEVETSHMGITYFVKMSAILRYDSENTSWAGPYAWLREIQPTWVECHTYNQWGDEFPNDFRVGTFESLI